MGIFRRRSTQQDPDFRAIGREAAFGARAPTAPERADDPLGLDCGSCGVPGRIDMIDTTVRRAYLTCRRCGRTWDTDRAKLPATLFFSRS